MSHHRKATEFISVVDEQGRISIPEDVLRQVEGRVHVRLSPVHLSAQLHEKGVSEEEVEHLGAVQLESREQVVKFLLSEGALSGAAVFRMRAEKFVRGKAE